MAKTLEVIAVGALNVDIIIRGEAPKNIDELNQWVAASQVEITTAGSIGYTAIALARLGKRVAMFSTVADDPLGEFILTSLAREGVDTSAITVQKSSASGIGIYMLLFGSKKRPLTGRLATHAPWPKKLPRAIEQKFKTARALHCGGYLHYPDRWGRPTEELFRKAKKHGLLTSIDPQFPLEEIERPWLKHFGGLLKYVDAIFVDETEARAITGEESIDAAAGGLLQQGPELVVVKQGGQGALLMTRQEIIHQPAFPVSEMIDSIGAGDAFDAGMIFSRLAGYGLKEAGRFAAATAALTLKGMGGAQTAPTLSQVQALLKRRGKE